MAAAPLIKYCLTLIIANPIDRWGCYGCRRRAGPRSSSILLRFDLNLRSLIQNFLFSSEKFGNLTLTLQEVISISEVARVWVGGRNGGGGVPVKEPTGMFSTSERGANMRQNMEARWQIAEGGTRRPDPDAHARRRRNVFWWVSLRTELSSGIQAGFKEGWRWKGGPEDQSLELTWWPVTVTPLFYWRRFSNKSSILELGSGEPRPCQYSQSSRIWSHRHVGSFHPKGKKSSRAKLTIPQMERQRFNHAWSMSQSKAVLHVLQTFIVTGARMRSVSRSCFTRLPWLAQRQLCLPHALARTCVRTHTCTCGLDAGSAQIDEDFEELTFW